MDGEQEMQEWMRQGSRESKTWIGREAAECRRRYARREEQSMFGVVQKDS
jgi:hypothetical protein